MIYPIIIIVALAVAFIILIRRLPSGTDTSYEAHDETPRRAPRQEFAMPKFKLPAMPAFPKPKPRAAAPAPAPVTPVAPSAPATPPVPLRDSLKLRLPKFSLPKLPERQVRSAHDLTTPTPKELVTKEDFWQEEIEPAPTAPTPPPLATRTLPKTEPALPLPKPNKGRDPFREAEDAFAIKDYKKAERLYLRLATDDPKNPKIYSRLGIIYLEQKNYEDARDALQAALKLEPNIASRHFNLALAYLELGSRAKAINSMESALKYDPSNRKYRKMLDEVMAGRA